MRRLYPLIYVAGGASSADESANITLSDKYSGRVGSSLQKQTMTDAVPSASDLQSSHGDNILDTSDATSSHVP